MNEDSPRQPEPGTLIVLAVLFEGGLAPLSLLIGWLAAAPPLTGFAWRASDALLGALAAVPMLALYLAGQTWPVGPFRGIQRFLDEEARPLLAGCRWHDLALIALAAGVGEEMLFRGVIQAALCRWLGPGAGLGAASLLFGILHPITPGYIFLVALLGAYLGGVWMLNGNLLTVMVAHALYDFLALVLLLRGEPDAA